MSDALSDDEQDEIVTTLAVEVETLTDDEYEELYEQLDDYHKDLADDQLREWADDAVGDSSWRNH